MDDPNLGDAIKMYAIYGLILIFYRNQSFFDFDRFLTALLSAIKK